MSGSCAMTHQSVWTVLLSHPVFIWNLCPTTLLHGIVLPVGAELRMALTSYSCLINHFVCFRFEQAKRCHIILHQRGIYKRWRSQLNQKWDRDTSSLLARMLTKSISGKVSDVSSHKKNFNFKSTKILAILLQICLKLSMESKWTLCVTIPWFQKFSPHISREWKVENIGGIEHRTLSFFLAPPLLNLMIT